MDPKHEKEKAPGSQTPTDEPGKPARELGEDDLKQVAGGTPVKKAGSNPQDYLTSDLE